MSDEVSIEVNIKIKTEKIDAELTKQEAKKLRDALDKALKAESASEDYTDFLDELKKKLGERERFPKPYDYPGLPPYQPPLIPSPLDPRRYGQPIWEYKPEHGPIYIGDRPSFGPQIYCSTN